MTEVPQHLQEKTLGVSMHMTHTIVIPWGEDWKNKHHCHYIGDCEAQVDSIAISGHTNI